MKEENKVLRKVVEKTMQDYYDLQMKFAVIQKNDHKQVSFHPLTIIFFFKLNVHLKHFGFV